MEDRLENRAPQRIWPIIWRGKKVILGSVIAMVLLAFLYASSSAKVYEATAILQVNIPSQTPSVDTTAANEGLAQNFATLLVSSGFLGKIQSKVEGGRHSAGYLQSHLSAEAVLHTALVKLSSTGPSPTDAESLGGQVALAFLADLQREAADQTARQQSQISQTISKLSSEISALQALPTAGTPPTSDQISSLETSRRALVAESATIVSNGIAQGASATLSAPPAASSSPISPRRSLDLIGGLLLGLLLGVALSWLQELVRPGLRSSDEAAALLDLPVLASIPLRPPTDDEDPVLAEAYDVLRTNLLFAMHQRGLRVVTFVGPNARVGKTSVVEGLASSGLAASQTVVIVDGDMRAAALSSRLRQSHHPGMAELLRGSVTLDDALVQLQPGLWLIPAHSATAQAPSLLSSAEMRALSAELRDRFDLVLIDSPPIAGLADGLILASLSDAVVLIARTNDTKPADLVAAAASLHQSQTPIAGLVVFEERSAENYAYYPADEEKKPSKRNPALLR